MAENVVEIAAQPETVWSVLADPHAYGEWVVGTTETSTGDGSWPEVGSSLRYTISVGPFGVDDRTTVVESVPPRLLVLEATLRRTGSFGIRLELEPSPGGTRVTMVEQSEQGALSVVPDRLEDVVLVPRNDEALARLKRMAEARV